MIRRTLTTALLCLPGLGDPKPDQRDGDRPRNADRDGN